MYEIEKKYNVFLNNIKNLKLLREYYIEQNYIYYKDDFQIRLRKVKIENNHNYILTIKKGKGEIRKEFEFKLSKKEYNKKERLLQSKNLSPIKKIRREYEFNNKVIEVDIFKNPNKYTFAEIEFNSIDDMNKFDKPNFLGKEVNISNIDIWKSMNDLN